MLRPVLLGGLALVLLSGQALAALDSAPAKKEISWQPWSDAVFAEAKREHKFVLLDLHAVWCHWCHVMDEKTYSDPSVIALIQAHYIAVRADQDAHPDLASRYQDYGWPATVVFKADGSEIVKRQGFRTPEQMSSMLQAIIDDPTPGPSVTGERKIAFSSMPEATDLPTLQNQLVIGYDWKLGSWGMSQKFLNWDNVEYCLVQAQAGDAEAEKMARQTLTAQLQLIDPVWGGVDQYSAEGDWVHPHFEKIMQFQAENIRIYSEAYRLWKDPVYLQTAEGIYGYVRKFLTHKEGVVYASQDADLVPGEHAGDYFKLNDAERRKLGIPRIDQHVYTRENGWFIEALTALYRASDDVRYRDEATKAAKWIMKNRAAVGGGFRHGEEKGGPITLADNLAMGRAFLGLYDVTANRTWLDEAERTADFISGHFAYKFQGASLGFAPVAGGPDSSGFAPQPDFDENVSLSRLANRLYHYTGNSQDRQIAETALRFVGSPEVTRARLSSVGGLLLAETELASDPLHVVIVGGKSDALAKMLFETAISFQCFYEQVEWLDGHRSGAGTDAIQYPVLPTAAAYTCAQGACSSPVISAEKLTELLKRKTSPQADHAH